MRSPSIGAMRHRLVLEAPVETADLAGGVSRSWAAMATLWAAIEPEEEVAGLNGDAPTGFARHRVTIRWRPGITAGHRLTRGARIFAIRSAVDPDERRSRLVLRVEEFAA